jgi:hypothetical protein
MTITANSMYAGIRNYAQRRGLEAGIYHTMLGHVQPRAYTSGNYYMTDLNMEQHYELFDTISQSVVPNHNSAMYASIMTFHVIT